MRLFLSSQGLSNHPDALLKLLRGNRKTAFLDNAKDYLPESERRAHVDEKREEYTKAGLDFEELDLRDYFGKQEELAKKLNGFGLVWSSGGDNFILRKAMALSGLDNILKDMVRKDEIVYGGSSAGSIIVTPSLRGFERGEEPMPFPKNYPDKEIIWKGLNLVPYHFIPHHKSDWYGHEMADVMVDYMEKNKLPYKALKDGQVIVINGEKEELLK